VAYVFQVDQLERDLQRLDEKRRQFEPNITVIEQRMNERNKEIENIKENMNNVEDVVFQNFCAQIGVANIRQYEERELRTQNERLKKRHEFEVQKNRITSQLEFEQTRDTKTNVLRWERAVQDEEVSVQWTFQSY